MMLESAPAVELRGLTKRFGAVVANQEVNLRVERGTIHGVVGENGAGKSTAMKLLYGLYRPDGGQIFVAGEPRTLVAPPAALAPGDGQVRPHFLLAGGHPPPPHNLLGARAGRLLWGG